jgi:hypothetical protein
MTRISAPGNESGFVLLDALFCLFTSALILMVISGVVFSTIKTSAKTFNDGITIIEERNHFVEWRKLNEE